MHLKVDPFLFLPLTINPHLSRCHWLLPYSLVTENSNFSTPIVLFPIWTSLHYTLAIEKKSSWWWETLKAGREGDDRGWNGWMVWPTQWTWVWASFGQWGRTGKPGMLQSRGSQSQTRPSDWTTNTLATLAPLQIRSLDLTSSFLHLEHSSVSFHIVFTANFRRNFSWPPTYGSWRHLSTASSTHCLLGILLLPLTALKTCT